MEISRASFVPNLREPRFDQTCRTLRREGCPGPLANEFLCLERVSDARSARHCQVDRQLSFPWSRQRIAPVVNLHLGAQQVHPRELGQIGKRLASITSSRGLKVFFDLLGSPAADLGLITVTLGRETAEVRNTPIHN